MGGRPIHEPPPGRDRLCLRGDSPARVRLPAGRRRARRPSREAPGRGRRGGCAHRAACAARARWLAGRQVRAERAQAHEPHARRVHRGEQRLLARWPPPQARRQAAPRRPRCALAAALGRRGARPHDPGALRRRGSAGGRQARRRARAPQRSLLPGHGGEAARARGARRAPEARAPHRSRDQRGAAAHAHARPRPRHQEALRGSRRDREAVPGHHVGGPLPSRSSRSSCRSSSTPPTRRA
jgi:hypothetical protein